MASENRTVPLDGATKSDSTSADAATFEQFGQNTFELLKNAGRSVSRDDPRPDAFRERHGLRIEQADLQFGSADFNNQNQGDILEWQES